MNRSARLGVLLLLLSGCQDTTTQPAPPARESISEQKPAAVPREFKLEGDVISVDKEKKSAVIKHGNIEGYMGAMTMPYPIPDPTDLENLKPGDHITATIYDNAAESRYWLGSIKVGPAATK